jgi:hypothetical protein
MQRILFYIAKLLIRVLEYPASFTGEVRVYSQTDTHSKFNGHFRIALKGVLLEKSSSNAIHKHFP